MEDDSVKLIDRSEAAERMNAALQLDPAKAAAITIDCQRGNLEPEIASLPVPDEECERVIAGTNRMLGMVRASQSYPLGRIATTEDVAAAIVSLLTGGDFVTGQTLLIDGGLSLS